MVQAQQKRIRILIVDDNRNYREAFRRMLEMHDYDVSEAENADQALEVLGRDSPNVIVTDLWMRTKDEGMELIRQVKNIDRAFPIVMISAVGTFETGAEASRLGACYVVSKSRIEQEQGAFLEAVHKAVDKYRETQKQMAVVQRAKNEDLSEQEIADLKQSLTGFLTNPRCDEYIKSEAYDALLSLSEREMRETSTRSINSIIDSASREEMYKKIDENISRELSQGEMLDNDSLESLRSAEILYLEQNQSSLAVDFSRSIGFSYCFSVENEAKVRLRKKLNKLFSSRETYDLINHMMDKKLNNLDLFFHQYILRLQQDYPFEFTTDNVRQTLNRITQFEQCYKPDGLKALGIVILCFGRNYDFKSIKGNVKIDNPLGLKGIEEDTVVDFARQLVLLQHFRNPYIHPEISDMEKLSKLRQTAFLCLRYICRLV
jgi:DNA-binding NarL/FixJ family response regulator